MILPRLSIQTTNRYGLRSGLITLCLDLGADQNRFPHKPSLLSTMCTSKAYRLLLFLRERTMEVNKRPRKQKALQGVKHKVSLEMSLDIPTDKNQDVIHIG